MKTYADIKSEIARLEKQAEALRKSEVAEVIAKIKQAIKAYGLTAGDLGLGRGAAKTARTTPAKSATKASTTKGVPKYRDPKSGKTWTGRGKPPAWIAGVKNRNPYLIEGQVSEAASHLRRATKAPREVRPAGPAKAKPKSSRAKGRPMRRTSRLAPATKPSIQLGGGDSLGIASKRRHIGPQWPAIAA